jgi:integrase
MKKVAAAAKNANTQTQAAAAFTPHRSEILNRINVERWLGEQVKTHKKDKETSADTKAEYAKIAVTLGVTRAQPGEPVNIDQRAKTKNTFYKYRAAVRWAALENAATALRAYRNADNDSVKKSAYAVMLTAAADLVRYPADAQPGLSSASFLAAARALGDAEAVATLQKQAGEFSGKKGAIGKNDKLKDSNAIQRIEGWRALLFARLVDVSSPWIDHAAVAALTGCRPAEVSSVRIEAVSGALVITIPGVKVSDTKGQPYRKFSIKADTGPEFAHLLKRVKKGPVVLSSESTASAFSEALKRAGRQVFGEKTPAMTGYVYRHALACDMKADGADRDEIASALGHAVTKTQAHYGRASGGTKGARVFQIEATRPIKQTHGSGHRKGRDIAPNASPQPAPVNVFTSPGFEL